MDFKVHEVESTVHAMDGDMLLHPSILKQIKAQVTAAVNEQQNHERVVKQERTLRPSFSSREISFWE
jgi:hypothetical protein